MLLRVLEEEDVSLLDDEWDLDSITVVDVDLSWTGSGTGKL